jgi:hypothetical protein
MCDPNQTVVLVEDEGREKIHAKIVAYYRCRLDMLCNNIYQVSEADTLYADHKEGKESLRWRW